MKPLRIALIKPEWGIRGGFEVVVDRLVAALQVAGHRVEMVGFDAWATDRRPFGRRVSDEMWERAAPYFLYLSQIEQCRQLDVRRADMVISTQPPTWAVEHPRHLSLFFHHNRLFYELGEYATSAGYERAEFHAECSAAVRRIDEEALGRVKHILAGSETVADRLRDYHRRDEGVSVFHAGPSGRDDMPSLNEADRGDHGYALCVSRHDFPKRTELFVHAMTFIRDIAGVSVGEGGRFGFAKQLAGQLAARSPSDVADDGIWLNCPEWIDPTLAPSQFGNLTFAGRVSDDDLDIHYRRCAVVVAPALLEDYGLTALEAMRYGKPVITCEDSGHLGRLVRHGETGLVVDPTGRAIGEAVRSLIDNPELRRRMGEAARQAATEYTWSRAFDEFQDGIERVMA
jgi:glycosyltransferase involved in cell wall biosynthesis